MMRDAALELAGNGWSVFPCIERNTPNAKRPYTTHGYNDATRNPEQIAAWWDRWPAALIAVRADTLLCLDIDPRHGASLDTLEAVLGPLPATLTCWTGRGDGGRHLYFHRPPGEIIETRLPAGVDLKQAGRGYTIAPPSLHPETGQPYRWEHHEVAVLPAAAVHLLRRPPLTASPHRRRAVAGSVSVADAYSAERCWADVLAPHGWVCLDPDPDADRARWRHPTATSAVSATVRNGCLFVYSGNTPFPITTPGYPAGQTKFRAYAVLNHGGDLSTAGHALRKATS